MYKDKIIVENSLTRQRQEALNKGASQYNSHLEKLDTEGSALLYLLDKTPIGKILGITQTEDIDINKPEDVLGNLGHYIDYETKSLIKTTDRVLNKSLKELKKVKGLVEDGHSLEDISSSFAGLKDGDFKKVINYIGSVGKDVHKLDYSGLSKFMLKDEAVKTLTDNITNVENFPRVLKTGNDIETLNSFLSTIYNVKPEDAREVNSSILNKHYKKITSISNDDYYQLKTPNIAVANKVLLKECQGNPAKCKREFPSVFVQSLNKSFDKVISSSGVINEELKRGVKTHFKLTDKELKTYFSDYIKSNYVTTNSGRVVNIYSKEKEDTYTTFQQVYTYFTTGNYDEYKKSVSKLTPEDKSYLTNTILDFISNNKSVGNHLSISAINAFSDKSMPFTKNLLKGISNAKTNYIDTSNQQEYIEQVENLLHYFVGNGGNLTSSFYKKIFNDDNKEDAILLDIMQGYASKEENPVLLNEVNKHIGTMTGVVFNKVSENLKDNASNVDDFINSISSVADGFNLVSKDSQTNRDNIEAGLLKLKDNEITITESVDAQGNKTVTSTNSVIRDSIDRLQEYHNLSLDLLASLSNKYLSHKGTTIKNIDNNKFLNNFNTSSFYKKLFEYSTTNGEVKQDNFNQLLKDIAGRQDMFSNSVVDKYAVANQLRTITQLSHYRTMDSNTTTQIETFINQPEAYTSSSLKNVLDSSYNSKLVNEDHPNSVYAKDDYESIYSYTGDRNIADVFSDLEYEDDEVLMDYNRNDGTEEFIRNSILLYDPSIGDISKVDASYVVGVLENLSNKYAGGKVFYQNSGSDLIEIVLTRKVNKDDFITGVDIKTKIITHKELRHAYNKVGK